MAKGLVVGLSRGHIVTKIETPSWVPKTYCKFLLITLYFLLIL